MFAKLAQIRLRHVGSAQRAYATTIGYRADNPAACPLANTNRARRPTLVCRWQHAPATGALECVWEAVGSHASGRPRADRSRGEIRRLTETRAAARRPFKRAAA